MKNKKLKTFLIVIFIIIFVVLAYFVTKRIMFNRIEEKFWTAIAEAERNGSYHLIVRERMTSDADYQKIEIICKDGKYYSSDDNGSAYLMLAPDEVYDIYEIKDVVKRATLTPYIKYGYRYMKLHFFLQSKDYYDITKIGNGKYDGKDCYVITMEYYAGLDNGIKETVAYIDKETYLPYKVEGETFSGSILVDADSELNLEAIYDLIEFDDVEFPEINLDEYEITNLDI